MTKKCVICLEKTIKLWKTNCCKIYVHYHCQVQFGNECIICKNQLKCVSSTKYIYIPPFYEPIPQEIEEDRRVWEQLEERNYAPLFRVITEHLVEALMSDEEV